MNVFNKNKDDFVGSGGGFYWFHGVVEDIMDPLKMGRVRVRCFGYHIDNRNAIPTSRLPWALCLLPNTSASIAGTGQSAVGILPGTWVIGFFRDGPSAQDPIIIGTVASSTKVKPNATYGFTDPTGTNPTRLGNDIPSEVTTGTAPSKTALLAKYSLSVNPTPNAYIAPQYPYNQVIHTRAGHVIEYDDTPGSERLSFMHKSGAFIEIDPSGNINICGNTVNIKGATVNIN